MVSGSHISLTHVSAMTASTNCVVSCRAVSKVARSTRLALCAASPRPDNSRSVIVDLEIVCPDPIGFGEGFAVAFTVCAFRPNDTDEIMLPSCFVIQDSQEERGDGLPKSGEVSV